MGAGEREQRTTPADAGEVDRILSTWSGRPRETAQRLIEKYGAPHEACSSKLTWYDTEPWKRMEVQQQEVPHDFPVPHTDHLSQVIAYRVPVDRIGDVVEFNGSLLIDRTAGEVTARCDAESTNVLALNLMQEIVTGNTTMEDARQRFAEDMAISRTSAETRSGQNLRFDMQTNTADRDESLQPTVSRSPNKKGKDGSSERWIESC